MLSHEEYLGRLAVDQVTGLFGYITSVRYDIGGQSGAVCIETEKKGVTICQWFDAARIKFRDDMGKPLKLEGTLEAPAFEPRRPDADDTPAKAA
jgi:hypothetical protein